MSTMIRILATIALAVSGSSAGVPGQPAGAPRVEAAVPALSSDVFPGGMYVEADTDAARAAARLQAAGRTDDAALIRQISSQPTAVWLGEWFTHDQLRRYLPRHVSAARAQGATPVFVTYAVPNRDCGGYSAGGASYSGYLDWNRVVADELRGTGAVVLIEPDSLAMLMNPKCGDERSRRMPLLRGAVDILESAGLTTYLDGGNSMWRSPADQAALLTEAGVAKADGFYTNVSNFNRTQSERDYAGKLSSRVGWKHYVIDVSRNGDGWLGTWCNPPGASLGQNPTVVGGTSKLDALLWVKHPGASDGSCNGGPAAGKWWDEYALDLVRNR